MEKLKQLIYPKKNFVLLVVSNVIVAIRMHRLEKTLLQRNVEEF